MVFSDETEQSLLADAGRGSAQALATLLQANYAVVYRYLVKLTMNPHAAEDAAQDAMERAIRNFRSFDPAKAKFSTWLITIARNRWLDEVRKNKRVLPLIDSAKEAEQAPDAFTEIIESDDLLKALSRLDTKARTPVTMSYVLGYSYEEIAGHLHIPLGTVKSRISNAVKQLRKEMGGIEQRG